MKPVNQAFKKISHILGRPTLGHLSSTQLRRFHLDLVSLQEAARCRLYVPIASPRAFPPGARLSLQLTYDQPDLCDCGAPAGFTLSCGISTYLKPPPSDVGRREPTPWRALRRPLATEARHRIGVDCCGVQTRPLFQVVSHPSPRLCNDERRHHTQQGSIPTIRGAFPYRAMVY